MGFNFKKKYGQNFLNDSSVIKNIANSISPDTDDLIIEIGPGSGALTKELIKHNAHLICYEVDNDLHIYLDKLENENTHVIYDDFLTRDIKKDIEDIKYNNLYIIGNLPYYITTPIITKIIKSNLNILSLTFMVQKEVADRLSAKPGTRDYGYISVLLNYYFDIKKLFNVSKNKFYPMPKVDSAVIKLEKKENLFDVDIDKFGRLIKDAFNMKRKNLRNNLKQYDLNIIENILNKYDFSLNNRAEEIPYEVFVEIINNYHC